MSSGDCLYVPLNILAISSTSAGAFLSRAAEYSCTFQKASVHRAQLALRVESLHHIEESPDTEGRDVGKVLPHIGTENVVFVMDAAPRAVVRAVRVDDDGPEHTDARVATRLPRLSPKELHPSLPSASWWEDERPL